MNTAAHENDPVADTGPGLPGSSRPAGNQTRGGNISALERASRTLPLDRDAAIDAWVSAYGETTDHLGHACGAARPSRTDKRSFWRFSLDGAGRVEVSATPKATDRAVLAINHDGLPDAEQIEQWRAHWKQLLSTL